MFKLKKSVGLMGKLAQLRVSVAETAGDKLAKLEKKVEGTRAENWLKYWKTVIKDYRDVAVDVSKEMREKPSKAILIGSSMSLVTYFWQHNPSAVDFRDSYVKSANNLALVHTSLIRQDAAEHVKQIERCYNNELIRYTSLGVFSFIWVDSHSTKCNKFESQCEYLQLGYKDVLERIIDVGFLDTWWILAKKMTDYDVNY